MKKQAQSAKGRIKSPVRLPSGSIIDRARNDACRLDFVSFIEAVFNLLNPGRPFFMNWHILALAYHLEQVRLGRIKRLIINLPPRFLKSLISSIAFPAYVFGHDPTKRFLVVSYGLELAAKFAHDPHVLMSSGLYKAIFPGTRIARNAASEIVTTRGGHRFGTSLDGSVTGRGGDIIIIDDPLKLSDAESDSKREHVNDTYRNTIQSRLDDQNGAIIIVMQRLHPDDLCGMVLKHSDGWTVLPLPLVAERDEEIQIGESLYHLRRVGDLLHPEYFSQRAVDERRLQLDERIFAAQYQQDPLQPLAVMIKRDFIKRYNHIPIRRKESHYVIQSWDTAIKVDVSNDCSVCATLLVDDQRQYYLLEVLRDRLLYPDLKAQAIAQAKKHRPDVILIEEAGLGRTLIKDLQAAGFNAIGVIPEGDKLTRVSVQLEKFANGQVFFPWEAPWLVDLENELSAFPNGRYDDQVDALVQALAYKRPTFLWNDAALRGLENFTVGLMLSRLSSRG
jgi:predicted phage terminase large subunit-like protein